MCRWGDCHCKWLVAKILPDNWFVEDWVGDYLIIAWRSNWNPLSLPLTVLWFTLALIPDSKALIPDSKIQRQCIMVLDIVCQANTTMHPLPFRPFSIGGGMVTPPEDEDCISPLRPLPNNCCIIIPSPGKICYMALQLLTCPMQLPVMISSWSNLFQENQTQSPVLPTSLCTVNGTTYIWKWDLPFYPEFRYINSAINTGLATGLANGCLTTVRSLANIIHPQEA